MATILSNFSKAVLIEAIEANLFELMPVFCGCLPNAVYRDEPDAAWYATDIPFALFNGVIRAQLAPDGLDARIREQTDAGKPTVVAEPDSAIAEDYRRTAWQVGAAQAAERVDHSSKFGPIVVEPSK